MQPHQERVIQERDELLTKCIKLGVFIHSSTFHTIDKAEQRRLRRQYSHMGLYLEALEDRIDAFTES